MSLKCNNIYCIGRNYVLHAKELNNPIPENPVVFLKSSSSIRPLKDGELAFADETFHFEGEIVLRLGRDIALGEKVDVDVVKDVALGLDLTRRGEQSKLKEKGLPWTTSKSFVGSALLSEFTNVAKIKDLNNLAFTVSVNNEVRQRGNSKDMLFNIKDILNYLASFNLLKENDLIYTGTPAGVGEIKKGDSFSLEFNDMKLKFDGVL